jgi:hypothetical protein
MNVKEAADNLLKKGSITQEEYNGIDFEKVAAGVSDLLKKRMLDDAKGFGKSMMKKILEDPKSDVFQHVLSDGEFTNLMEDSFKTKPFDSFKKNIFNNSGAVTAGIAAGVVGKEGIVDPLIQRQKMNKSYSELSKYTPQLQEVDQNKIRDYFQIIKTYAPNAAANPLVAGAIVNKINEFGGVDHKLILDLLNMQSGKSNMESVKTLVGGGLKSFSNNPKD